MSRIVRVAGAACVGAVTGWWGTGLWQWAVESDERACESSTSLCLTLYPLAGFGSWLVLALTVFFFALRALDMGPRLLAVPACVFLQCSSLAVLSLSSRHEYAELSAVSLTVLALGPALVAACTVSEWRRAAAAALRPHARHARHAADDPG